MRFQNRVAVITGAGRGIGKAVAKKLFVEGCKIAVLDIDAASAIESAKSIDKTGERSLALACDISNKDSVTQAISNY